LKTDKTILFLIKNLFIKFFLLILHQLLSDIEKHWVMYNISKTAYGIRINLNLNKEGLITGEEATRLYEELNRTLERLRRPIGYFIDMRNLRKMKSEDLQTLYQFKQNLVDRGIVKRTAYIMNNAVSMLQMKRISRDIGLLKYERFIDVNMVENWEEVALGWLINAQDPTPKRRR
jgi:hypothetical protein